MSDGENRERLALKDTPKEIVDFLNQLDGLISGTSRFLDLPFVRNGRDESQRVNDIDDLQSYIDNCKALGVYKSAELNEQALRILDEVEVTLKRPADEAISQKIANFSEQLDGLISGTSRFLDLPFVRNDRDAGQRVNDVDDLQSYIDNCRVFGVYKNAELNEQALRILDEVAVVLDLAKKLQPEEIELANNAPDMDALISRLSIRTNEDFQRRDTLLLYAKKFKRLKIKLALFGSLNTETTPSIDSISEMLKPLESTDADDRALLVELGNKYGDRLVADFQTKAFVSTATFRPELRRQLEDEAKRLFATGFIANGSEARLGIILEAVAVKQRRYFDQEFFTQYSEGTISAEAIEVLINRFDILDVADLDNKETLRQKAFARLRDFNRNRLLLAFRTQNAETIIGELNALPTEYPEDEEFRESLLQQYRNFLTLRKDIKVDDYNFVFKQDIELVQRQGAIDYEVRNVGRNTEGAKLTRENFRERLLPLLQAFEGDKEAMARIAKALSPDSRQKFVIDLDRLRAQRELTPVEEAWFRSAELTSFSIPYLVALVSADRDVAIQYLEYLFAKISRETKEKLNQVQYFPAVVIGQGPNAIAGLAEVRRLYPQLVRATLVVDAARNAGGPFAQPETQSFNLNSQAARVADEPKVGPKPSYDEGSSIQGHASPLQELPGGRGEGEKAARNRSINQIDPTLIADKDIAGDIYPSNEDLEIVAQLLSAMTAKNLALQTRLIDIEVNNTGLPGDKLLTLEITEADGTVRIQQVTTDILIDVTGLGERSFGFDTKGTRAEKVIEASDAQTESVPKVSTTLDAFRGLGGRYEEEPGSGLGLVVGIGGTGNSFDTLAEKLVGKFVPGKEREQAKQIRDTIGKIYVFAENPPKNAREYLLSQRSRYAALADFIDQKDGLGANERLITFVDTRITDFDFADNDPEDPNAPKAPTPSTSERKLVVYGKDGQKARNKRGQVIQLDNLFMTTGFTDQTPKLFEKYSRQLGQDGFKKSAYTLAAAPGLQVGEQLEGDPNVLFLGTAAAFASTERLRDQKLADIARVSPEAASALIRVGAKNLVALGVKTRDSVAAINDFIWNRRDQISGLLEKFDNQQLDKTIPAARVAMTEAEEANLARLSNRLSTAQKRIFAGSVISEELQGVALKDEASRPLDRDYVFEFSMSDRMDIAEQPKSIFKRLTGALAGRGTKKPIDLSLLDTRVEGVYENALRSLTEVVGEPDRITRASNVYTLKESRQEAALTEIPTEIQKALRTPHFLKAMSSIIPFSNSGKYRLRVSVRQGRVLPQRTQVVEVAEF